VRSDDDQNEEQSMTYTVFLSGSRKITRLNEAIRTRLEKITSQNFKVVVGDANGADKAIQTYLADIQYQHVTVYCAGDVCRNNVGSWPEKNIDVSSKLKGRDFYVEKDKAMAATADYGFVLWDGKSAGSINNVLEMMKNRKPVITYFGPDRSFHALRQGDDVKELMKLVDARDYREMDDKVHVNSRLKDLRESAQGVLTL
jgi:hypothetical protein